MSKLSIVKPGPRRNRSLRQQQRSVAQHLVGQGLFQGEIAEQLGLSQSQVSRDLAVGHGAFSLPGKTRVRHGYVYLARLEGTAFFKIGQTVNPVARFKELNRALPIEILIICAVATEKPSFVERALHRHFAEQRVKGEWFTLNESTALRVFINAIEETKSIASLCVHTAQAS